jgi:hypothetical protein
VSWEFAPTFDAAHRAALEAAKPLVYVCPPAGWALAPLLDRLPGGAPGGPAVLVLVATPAETVTLAAAVGGITALHPVHALTGQARTVRLLATGTVRTLIGTPAEALALARASALPLAAVRHVVVAWPEAMLALGQNPALDAVLGETRDAQRLVATADERDPALADLLIRLAHRAPVVVASRLPEEPLAGHIRYAVTDDQRRVTVARALLDTVNPERALLWEPLPSRVGRWESLGRDPQLHVGSDPGSESADAALAADLPSADALAALLAAAREVLVLVEPQQLGYLRRLAPRARAVRVAGESDTALDRALAVRRRLRERLDRGGLDAELLAIGPLLDEYDPALVAAAALGLAETPAAAEPPEVTGWVRVRISLGRRDGLRPADVVGALVNEVGVAKAAVGRIELRDACALVEVRAAEAERAVRGLTGTTIRGRRIVARLERR